MLIVSTSLFHTLVHFPGHSLFPPPTVGSQSELQGLEHAPTGFLDTLWYCGGTRGSGSAPCCRVEGEGIKPRTPGRSCECRLGVVDVMQVALSLLHVPRHSGIGNKMVNQDTTVHLAIP